MYINLQKFSAALAGATSRQPLSPAQYAAVLFSLLCAVPTDLHSLTADQDLVELLKLLVRETANPAAILRHYFKTAAPTDSVQRRITQKRIYSALFGVFCREHDRDQRQKLLPLLRLSFVTPQTLSDGLYRLRDNLDGFRELLGARPKLFSSSSVFEQLLLTLTTEGHLPYLRELCQLPSLQPSIERKFVELLSTASYGDLTTLRFVAEEFAATHPTFQWKTALASLSEMSVYKAFSSSASCHHLWYLEQTLPLVFPEMQFKRITSFEAHALLERSETSAHLPSFAYFLEKLERDKFVLTDEQFLSLMKPLFQQDKHTLLQRLFESTCIRRLTLASALSNVPFLKDVFCSRGYHCLELLYKVDRDAPKIINQTIQSRPATFTHDAYLRTEFRYLFPDLFPPGEAFGVTRTRSQTQQPTDWLLQPPAGLPLARLLSELDVPRADWPHYFLSAAAHAVAATGLVVSRREFDQLLTTASEKASRRQAKL